MNPAKIAILGSGFSAEVHLESYHRFIPEAEIIAIYSRSLERAAQVAEKHKIPFFSDDMDKVINLHEVEIIDVCLPNFLHCGAVEKAAAAKKHIIVEKPLAMNLEECQTMIRACKNAGVKLMYAEELCFAPKYERVRKLILSGAVGQIYQLRQCEKHSGPHSNWFYNPEQSGGGALMDMGCHGIGWLLWIIGKETAPISVFATMGTYLHKNRTKCEDNSICVVEFANGTVGIVENSWAKHGGMDDRIEVYGTGGVVYADLFIGNSALTYSQSGYDYAMEKAASTRGWSFTVFEEVFNQGYPHELQHFIKCVQHNEEPCVSGEFGMMVMEIICAAYYSAKIGSKVKLPFKPSVKKPIDLWLK
ncbi:MAG: Gfo/Idh/MocA family oxidoreductase [Verrucomicrobiae bacterium]|nr:Gfo/Idh/MocA family oxidoreductase [Verrucomicrobiae bacterium]